MAGKKAFLDAVGKARPIVLEPVVDLEVTVPQSNMGGHRRRPLGQAGAGRRNREPRRRIRGDHRSGPR